MPDTREFKWKQCLVVRADIRMSCGKKCAQTAHAAIGAYEKADKVARKAWLDEGQKKVVLKVQSERELYELKTIAERAGIPASIIQDAGMTEIPPGTVTALGLGPARAEDLDRITGDLSLL
ncbi:MAG: peptidyl-tRNA hydrolase [Methanoculleus bourgensis]|jgi:PTH2 family peptidyl-tRNA hydrolase|uniref:Peptidyl-tRNA hydrolase n=1 Tax=Methanoculleus bourgensis TaxID=83986 RepID=A0A0X3BKX5_9EURY|nr:MULTISPECIES: peptidyl-tRNA hydrolase Pth2 [Methanoculleus]MDD3373181.1 peptidyl-tRNA hydrolase Pth2 [Methanoculleus bourgensis]NMA89361.1 peptidyl-tRNA hydrolase [Methanoculleus bourgensis]NQS79241.1 peptidyl-tRNA hydrolase [Methanoculleus bourgensis]CVK32728.1 Peptidyl-tRNA hydrolase [Methanoculleus bourgensis]SAI88548.1 peptidyl-tRNA hydrolase, PTH2 family [Methanoculleus bourgensis]